MIRLKTIGKERDLVEKLKGMKSTDPNYDWKITYATRIYGGWDAIVECSFSELKDLDDIITFCRFDKEISSWIEETTTFIGSRNDYTG